MIIENMQTAEQNPEGMAYIFHPSGLKFNCVTPKNITTPSVFQYYTLEKFLQKY